MILRLLALGWIALAAIAVERLAGWQAVIAAARSASPSVLLLAAATQVASYALRALRVYAAEPQIPRGRYGDCLRLVLLHNLANLLLPARAGEAGFPLLLHRWFNVDPARATGTLLWLRLLDLATLALLLPLCLSSLAPGLRWIAAPAAVAVPALALVLAAGRGGLLRRLARREGRWRRGAEQALSAVPATPGALLRDLLLSVAVWSVKLAGLGAALAAFAQVSWPRGIVAAAAGELTTVLPLHAPAGVGTFEAGVVAALAGAAPAATALAGAVNLHLLILALALTGGSLAAACGRRTRTVPTTAP